MIKKFINKHALFLLLLAYFFFYLAFLQDVPIWWMDESWGSECAWNFAQTGIMGEVSFGTVYNINNYCFGIGSITHLLLISASFFLFGLGIFQARIVSVLLGAIVVFFVFKIAEKIFNDRKVASLATILLIVNPIFFIGARQARVDIGVVAFSMVALYLYLISSERKNKLILFASGIFAGLALTAHLNGIFTIIALLVFLCFDRLKIRDFLILSVGILIGTLPFGFFVLSDFTTYAEQTVVLHGMRMELGNLGFWAHNIFNEVNRYWNLRVLIGFVPLLLMSFVASRKTFKSNKTVKYLWIMFFTYFFSLWLFVYNQTIEYLIYMIPLLCILSASLIKTKIYLRRFTLVSVIFICLFTVFFWFGSYGGNSYSDIEYNLQSSINEDTKVLAMPRFWFAVEPNIFYSTYYLELTNSTLDSILDQELVNTVILDCTIPERLSTYLDVLDSRCYLTNSFQDSQYPDKNITIFQCGGVHNVI